MSMRILCLCLLMFSLCAAAGCRGGSPPPPAGREGMRRIVDQVGREVSVPPSPRRIVALAPSIVEILYCVGAGNRIVGVTTFTNTPPEAAKKPKVGSYAHLDVEKIVSLSPDLAIGIKDGNEKRSIDRLEELRIPVVVLDPKNVSMVIDEIEMLGNITGQAESSAQKAKKLRERLALVQKAAQGKVRPRVFLQLNLRPIVTAGPGTFSDDIIRLAGGQNIVVSDAVLYPVMSTEKVVALAPDVIIISSMGDGQDFAGVKAEWERWSAIPAVKSRRVYGIEADILRPSPKIVDVIEKFFTLIHPGSPIPAGAD